MTEEERENLERVREAYRAISEGDLEALAALCHPDVEFVSRVTDIEGGSYRGLDGLREWWGSLIDVFPSIQAEILEVVAITADSMVLRNRLTGRARASGMEVDQSWFQAGRARDGKFVWWGFYETAGEALEAENLERVREAYRALSRRDLEAFVALCHPDVQFVSRVTDIEGGAYRGLDGVRDWWARLFDVFPSIQWEIVEVVALTADSIVFRNRLTGRARASGMEVEQSWFQAVKSRDGKLVWWGSYDTAEKALEAVRLNTSAAGRASARRRS